MPELPEVENVRRTLSNVVLGSVVTNVKLGRHDVVRGGKTPADLLKGQRIVKLERLGKQLAILGSTDGCICVHLGMTGSLRFHPPHTRRKRDPHVHATWHLDNGRIEFRDPRRFGGLWTFPDRDSLINERWQVLGSDATTIKPRQLFANLQKTRRLIKAALLDQRVVAGLGNIYVDELLFSCRIHPKSTSNLLPIKDLQRLVRQMRQLLEKATKAGGSTLRDYVDADGSSGGFQLVHRVYGRGGEPCALCELPLSVQVVAGRTTVFCDGCQYYY